MPVQVTLTDVAPVATIADGIARSMPRARIEAFMIVLAAELAKTGERNPDLLCSALWKTFANRKYSWRGG